MKKRISIPTVSLLLLQVALCVFVSAKSSFASVTDSNKGETKLFAAPNAPNGQLLFTSGPCVPVAAAIAKCNHFSGQGVYHKDVFYPGSSLTHSEKSFFKVSSDKPSVLQKQNMRLHLACRVLLI